MWSSWRRRISPKRSTMRFSIVLISRYPSIPLCISVNFCGQWFVGPPPFSVRYRILLHAFRELQRVGCIEGRDATDDGSCEMATSPCQPLEFMPTTDHPELQHCARLTEGFSCRTMKKLPFLAYTRSEGSPPISCSFFLDALRCAIQFESSSKSDLPNSQTAEKGANQL